MCFCHFKDFSCSNGGGSRVDELIHTAAIKWIFNGCNNASGRKLDPYRATGPKRLWLRPVGRD